MGKISGNFVFVFCRQTVEDARERDTKYATPHPENALRLFHVDSVGPGRVRAQ